MVKAYLLHFLTALRAWYSRCTVVTHPLPPVLYTGYIPGNVDSTIASALAIVKYLKGVTWENMSPKDLSRFVFLNCRFTTFGDILDRLHLASKALRWVDTTLKANATAPDKVSLYQLLSSDGTYNRSRNAALILLALSDFQKLGEAYKRHVVPDYVAARHNVSVIEDDLRDVANIMLSLRDMLDHK